MIISKKYRRTKARLPSAEDITLFRETIGAVTPLSQETVMPEACPPPSSPRTQPRHAIPNASMISAQAISHQFEPATAITGANFARSGLSQQLIKKLRRGQFPRQAILDLHGLNIREAHQALTQFLTRCQQQHLRCIHVIHGKGQHSPNQTAVLKTRVHDWLTQWDIILAFCPALPYEGGHGAVYVLLKQKKTIHPHSISE